MCICRLYWIYLSLTRSRPAEATRQSVQEGRLAAATWAHQCQNLFAQACKRLVSVLDKVGSEGLTQPGAHLGSSEPDKSLKMALVPPACFTVCRTDIVLTGHLEVKVRSLSCTSSKDAVAPREIRN